MWSQPAAPCIANVNVASTELLFRPPKTVLIYTVQHVVGIGIPTVSVVTEKLRKPRFMFEKAIKLLYL